MFTLAQSFVVFMLTLAVSAGVSVAQKRLRKPYQMRLPNREVTITRDVLLALRAKPARLARKPQVDSPSIALSSLR